VAKEEREERLRVVKETLMAGILPDVHVVDDVQEAARVCHLLMTHYKDSVFACDTEVSPHILGFRV
jgi:hypothetical protein